ncbi:MAG TPA: DM13 domain-containing protein [Candidatus Nanoarchaeia archaeon]|nr:DM13 domain-containing protein [Candidatus Nanoarchaeia archaeon]
MVKITLNTFRDLIEVLKQKSLKDIFFGKEVSLSRKEQQLLDQIKKDPNWFGKIGGRKGNFIKKDLIHKGTGAIYLLPRGRKRSILLFDNNIEIQSGPDLYVYLSTNDSAHADILSLGLLKGTKGGQSYYIQKPMNMLQRYKYVLIHCKKFDVLFTYAPLR